MSDRDELIANIKEAIDSREIMMQELIKERQSRDATIKEAVKLLEEVHDEWCIELVEILGDEWRCETEKFLSLHGDKKECLKATGDGPVETPSDYARRMIAGVEQAHRNAANSKLTFGDKSEEVTK